MTNIVDLSYELMDAISDGDVKKVYERNIQSGHAKVYDVKGVRLVLATVEGDYCMSLGGDLLPRDQCLDPVRTALDGVVEHTSVKGLSEYITELQEGVRIA